MIRLRDRMPTHPRPASAVTRRGGLLALALAVSLAACGGGEDTGGAPGADGAQSARATDAGPRVFFVQPEDGATVTSPVRLVFGSENIQVSAVPETVDEPREGTIHYHLGVDTDCLAPGTRIPNADPWIHFGDGSNEIEMQLSPGEHRLTVQAGNDQHVTPGGMCQTITVDVTEVS